MRKTVRSPEGRQFPRESGTISYQRREDLVFDGEKWIVYGFSDRRQEDTGGQDDFRYKGKLYNYERIPTENEINSWPQEVLYYYVSWKEGTETRFGSILDSEPEKGRKIIIHGPFETYQEAWLDRQKEKEQYDNQEEE